MKYKKPLVITGL